MSFSLNLELRQKLIANDELGRLKPTLTRNLDYENTHREVVEGCKRGDRKAQFELYRLYSQAMYNVCLRMVKKSEDAEDLLQRSFMDVYQKLHTFRFESSVGAWIKRITVNNCINFLKKRRLEITELEERHATYLEDEDLPESQINVKAINAAIFELPDGYRVVFSLYLLEGYDHKEIADILGITEATSKSQYSRAKKKLKEILSTKTLIF